MGREAIMNIVAEVEKELNLTFGPEEIREVLGYTIRKAKIAGQGESYIPLLFEDELRNFAIRDAVNLLGWEMRQCVVPLLAALSSISSLICAYFDLDNGSIIADTLGISKPLAVVENAVSLIDFKSTSIISDMTCGVQLEAYDFSIIVCRCNRKPFSAPQIRAISVNHLSGIRGIQTLCCNGRNCQKRETIAETGC